MNIKNIPLNLIDVAHENIRKDHSFGNDTADNLMTEHLSKYDLLQPVVVRFDNQSKRYKLLIGRRRFLALRAKGQGEIPSIITNLEGSEAEAASLFENLLRTDLLSLEKARIVKRLIESTKSGISGFSAKYGIPKSSISEWLSILKLPPPLQERIEKGEITSYEAIQIARRPKYIHKKLVAAAKVGKLQEKMSEIGVKRGAPKGLFTIRLVFNPRKKLDQHIWEKLNQKADQNGLDVSDYARSILVQHIHSRE
jgi:ParB family chromosome partitioning protein